MVPPLSRFAQDLDPRRLLRVYGIKPRKGLGQHFLAASWPLEQIMAAAELGPEDQVLEIGPGLGVLTQALTREAGKVVAVELDASMRRVLADQLGHRENLRVVDADILAVEPAELLGFAADARGTIPHYRVVANLPYQITSAALRHILDAPARPERALFMLQREVADRILAKPGQLSILAVAVQLYAEVTRVCDVPASAFYPPPKVDSTVLRLDVHAEPSVDAGARPAFFKVLRAGFSQKRKQLKNSLAAGLGVDREIAMALLSSAGIDAERRAQSLSLEEWATLSSEASTAGLI